MLCMQKEEGELMAKVKFHANIDVADNGSLVTIKKGKEVIGSKVFKNEEMKDMKEWMDSLTRVTCKYEHPIRICNYDKYRGKNCIGYDDCVFYKG